MAELAGERAGAMFSPSTIHLSGRRGSGSAEAERVAGGWTGGAARRLAPERGAASGPPTRPSLRLREVSALGFAERTHHREPKGQRGGGGVMAF
eukprot:2118785-Pleurochrysis_carterae.AAC.3